jgi:hypothetical protein
LLRPVAVFLNPDHGLKAEDPSNPEILPPPGQFVPH